MKVPTFHCYCARLAVSVAICESIPDGVTIRNECAIAAAVSGIQQPPKSREIVMLMAMTRLMMMRDVCKSCEHRGNGARQGVSGQAIPN
jgi:hypothetical protein